MHPNVLALHVLKPKENRHLPYSSPHSQGSFSDITLLNWLASWFAIADVVVPSLFWATSRCCCCCHCSCSMIIGKTGSAAVGLLFALIFRLWSEISNPREAKERKIGFKFERSGLCCCERVVAIKQIQTASFTITTKTKRSAWWMGGFIEREAGKMDREKLCGDTNKRLTRWNLGSRQLLLLVGKLEWEAFPLSLFLYLRLLFSFPFAIPSLLFAHATTKSLLLSSSRREAALAHSTHASTIGTRWEIEQASEWTNTCSRRLAQERKEETSSEIARFEAKLTTC